MLVSIIVPLYNVEDYILSCLQSIALQQIEGCEVIIVDDCGTDHSVSIVKQYIGGIHGNRDGKEWKIISHDQNKGLSAARNTGIKVSRGKWLLFLDSDDLLEPDALHSFLKMSEREDGIQMIIGNYRTEPSNKTFSSLNLEEGVYSQDMANLYCQKFYYTMAFNKLVLREWIIKNNLYFEEGLIHEDVLWSFQTSLLLNKIAVTKQVTYCYMIRPGSIQQGSSFEKHQLAYERVTELMAKFACQQQRLNQKSVYFYIDEYQYHCFMDPLWSNLPKYSFEFYHRLRTFPHISFFRRIFLGGTLSSIIAELHYYLPEEIGFKWYRRWRSCTF